MMLLISVVTFFIIHLAPHSMMSSIELNPNLTKELIEEQKKLYGLDKPMVEQYLIWLRAMLVLDFGVSFATGEDVLELIQSKIGITLLINIISMLLIFWIAIYLGIKSAMSERVGKVIKQFSLISFSMPSFYLATLMLLLFALKLELLPLKADIECFLCALHSLFMPIFVAVFVGVGSLTLYVRNLSIEILKSDYIFFAKSRGISEKLLIKRYIIPNLLPPIITMLGLAFPTLIAGSIILETIFSISGMGLLFFDSALSKDYPVIMGILIITALLTLLGNLLADATLHLINPFFKHF